MKISLPLLVGLSTTIKALDLTWTGQIELNKSIVTLSGDAKSVYHQILAINPNYDEELGSQSNITRERDLQESAALQRRDPIGSDIRCPIAALPSASLDISGGISYLYRIGNGNCGAPPGPGGCSRVSCDHDNAIWLCNDINRNLNVPCRIVADNAQGIYDSCRDGNTDWPDGCPGQIGCAQWTYSWIKSGQIFSMDGTWNVIMGSRSCGLPANQNPF